jgi:histidyl-tRNA synthetase
MITKEKKPAWQVSEYDKPLITASYFGFIPIATPKITPLDLEAVSHCVHHPHYDASEKAALIRTYLKENFAALPHPLALAYRKAGNKKKSGYNLHFIGCQSGLAEAALIRAALSILAEEGYQNLKVELNSVGDKESLATYERELQNYVKKFGGELNENLRTELKADVFNLFRNDHEEMMQFRNSAPSSVSYLSSSARAHFKEVLEFVEALGVEFSLSPELIGEKNHASHTVFSIKSVGLDRELAPEAPEVLAVGYRYSRLSKKLGLRKEVPMASVSIFLTKDEEEKKLYKELPKPKFYLVQLGRDAKIKTLGLIENLRSNRIPVHHFIGKDKLTAQLQSAEQLKVSYLIIIGQKEALDGTATIRNMSTRAQETIPLSELPAYLKNIKL